MQIKIIQKPKPCKGWESWCEAVTLAGMMLVIGRDKSAEIGWFETRLIDAQNAAEVAQKLGLSGNTVYELSAHLRSLGAYIEKQQPPGTGIRAKFIKNDFRPCR